jgi:hypothetical protein
MTMKVPAISPRGRLRSGSRISPAENVRLYQPS